MHRSLAAVPLLFAVAFALDGCRLFHPAKAPAGPEVALASGARVGEPAPEIEGDDADGRRFKLSEYRGKVVVVDFWGNW